MALLARSAGGGAAPGGTLGAMAWNNIFAVGAGQTNRQSVSGITGSHSISAAITGGGTLFVNKSGTVSPYAGPFTVGNGASLAWLIVNPGSSTLSGTVSVTDATTATLIGSFSYVVNAP